MSDAHDALTFFLGWLIYAVPIFIIYWWKERG